MSASAMIARFLARSLKNAHRRWQKLEADLAASRQDLARKLETAKMAAQATGVDAPEQEGVLREAHSFTAAPLPKGLLSKHTALGNAFAILGSSFWRSTPPRLQEVLDGFETLVAERRYDCEALGQRLYTVCTSLDTIERYPEYAFGLSPHMVLRHPEFAEGLLRLGKKQWEGHQVSLTRLQRGFLNRIDLGLGWLRVLESKMKPFQFSRAKLNLGATKAQAPPETALELEPWLALHQRLDQQLLVLNRLAIASLSKDESDSTD